MRLFNRLIGGLQNSDANKENNTSCERKIEGARANKADRKRNMTAKKLGLEALEERQLLSVNPIGAAEYNEIREEYVNLALPANQADINVISVDKLDAESLQAAIDQVAKTPQDDLIVLNTTADNYVLNLDATAVTINLDSSEYGKLTIVGGLGENALTVVTQDANAFTVLNGDVVFDGMVLYNFSSVDLQGGLITTTDDANVAYGDSFAMVNEVAATSSSDVKYNIATPNAAGMEIAKASVATAPVYGARFAANVEGTYVQVADRLNAILRRQLDFFGFTPQEYRVTGNTNIYDAECNGMAGWVGTMANMLSYTGWAQRAGFSTHMTLANGTVKNYESVEDAVVDYLRNAFINTSQDSATVQEFTVAEMLDYFFSGNDKDCMGRNLSSFTNTVEGGGHFMDVDFQKVGGYVPASDSMILDMAAALRAGNAVTLEVLTTYSTGQSKREYVSVWGYTYSPNTDTKINDFQRNNANDVYGLICTNPLAGTYRSDVTYNYYGNNEQNGPYNGTFYYDDDSSAGYNTYHRYLLDAGANSLRLATNPNTVVDENGNLVDSKQLPEGYQYFGKDLTAQDGRTQTSTILGFSWLAQHSKQIPECEMNEGAVLALESMPGNTQNVIFLNFAGAEGTGWDGFEHQRFNLDDAAGYGVAEMQMIEEIWQRVAEDYAPFNVNVTTNPAVWAAAQNGIRCVIGGDYDAAKGGVSGVGTFGAGKPDNYVYPFNLSLSAKNIAEAATHEIGHSLGLGHDGYEHNEYYSGQNSDIWAPIMGTGYSAVMTQWSCGDYVNATNFQDDVAIIASKVGYRVDEHGNTYDQATDLRDFYVDVDLNNYDPNAGTYRVESVIIDRNDVDVFSFTSYGGTYVVDVSGVGADHRFIDNDFNWNTRLHANEENPVFAGKYYASTRNYTNLNLKVSLLDESGNTVLLDKNGDIMKLGYGEKTRAFYGSGAHDSDYHFYVVDQFGNPVYLDDAKTILKEGYYAVDDSYYTTFSHFVTPELEYGKTYYISVTGVGQGSSSTNGYSDYGSIGQYVLSMHESYENFYIDSTKMDVQEMSNSSGVDNVLNWKEAFVYSGRRLEDGSRYLGNTLVFNADLAGTTITLDNTLNFTYSRGIVGQPWAAKRFVLDAMNAWDTVNNRPGITFDAGGKFRTIYVNNTTLEMYGFVITGGTAARGTSSSQVNNGGGVYNNYGWLTIGNSIIAGNTALKAGAGIYNSGGEYEDNGQHDGWLYVIDSEIVGNKLLGGDSVGAGVFNESGAVATLVNVTVAGNTAGYSGGGVQNFGVVNAYNSIIAKNYAAYGADVYTIAGQGLTQVYSTIIGDESRNARLDAYRTGTDSLGDANSKIGNSAGSSVSSPVTVYDPGFVSYRDYDSEDWSQELWKYWNLHLVGDSIAVNIGMNPNFATNLDRTNGRVQASVYNRMGNKRYYVDSSDITTDMAGQNRIEGGKIDAGAFEALAKPDLTEFVPTSAGSDVVNNWENSIVVSRAIDDQTGSVAPFLVDEPLYLNLGFINQGAAITTDFETTVYMWKFDAYTPKAQMYANSTRDNGLPIMNIKVEFPTGAAMPGGTGATITCTNLATGEVQTFNYDGSTSYLLLENVKLDSVQNLVDGLIDNGVISAQNEEGYFLFGYELDSNADLAEYSETNNFYRTSSYFDVVESPVSINDSIVVTTTLDVVDPYDGEISLREAVEVYAGSFYYAEVALQDGDTFEANGVTYRVIDGKFYVDVTSSYQVYPGEQFTINTDVTITATWSDVAGSLVDADNNPITAPNGTIMIKGGVEYVYDQMTGSWLDSEDSAYAFADGETVSWASVESLVITYVTDVFYNGEDKIVDVPNGSVATIDGVEYVLAGDVWVHAEIVAQYTRDDVQAQGSFTMEDGSVVTVVNGVFRREMTDDVAIVPDGSVVQLANGETAVYNFAQDRFVVTEVTTRSLADGDSIEFAGETITLVADSYVDPTNTRFYLAEGTIVTLSNGYTVTYDDGRFVYNTEAVSATKLAAGTTVILNGEEYSYKAGRALVKRVSRESNAVVFADYLDGQTFELTQGPLTLDKTFTLDCIDPLGNILDLTITSHSDNPCLFLVKSEADVTIMNFKFEGAVSEEEGAILENYGELTINNVTFKDNVAKQGNLIYNASDATLNVVGSVFESNTAENSALIFNLGSANISAGTTFTDDYGLRSPIYTSGSLTVDETQFTATSGENGGAILNDGGSVVVARSVFNETSAENKGGAIANIDAADLRVFDSTFSGCFAIDGGAIFNGENGKLTTEATIFQQNNAVGLGGAIYNAGILEEKGSTFEENEAVSGAAIYSEGELKAVGSTFGANVATNAGGAIYSSADSNAAMNIIGAIFIGNVATDGAAVYAGSDAAFSNSLFAKNQATGMGGAVYAAANTTFVNVTIADNNAGEGAGLYNAGTATIDNSILAGNVGAQGNDLYTKEGATTTLRNSLLADIAKVGAGFATDANYRSLLGVAPEFVDPAADDYSLKATSPAINAGSNDLENAETDLAGAARRVGLTIGGVVRTVDMGAFEYQSVVAPDLAIKADTVDYWGAEVIANGATTELGYFIAGQGVCIDFNVQNVGDARVIDNFGFNVKLVGLDAAGNTIYDQTLPTQYYATDFINHNWLNVADWIDVNGEATLMTNFGALPAGYYTVTVTLDVFGVGAVYEYGEEDGFVGENNNVFVGTFNVFSEPSTVVTTDADVVDPVDGETSLREAIQAAGDYVYVSTTLVADGTTFTLENGEVLTVVDGWLTQSVDVVVKDGVQYDLQEGDEFILNGRSIYYHYQMNGGYFTYGVDPDSARVSQEALNNGPITYPDGSSASFSLQTAQYIHYVDETDLNPQEGAHYTYNVLKTSEGDVVLQDGMEFNISNVKFTYRQNETYPQGAFLFEDGTLVEYEDGGILNFASLAIGSLSTRNARVEKAVILADGSTLEVKNGVAKIYKEIDSNVTFDKAKMQNKTIVVDPAKGPVVLDKTTTLIGSSVVIDRELAILGEDRNVSISGNDATNMFLVNTDTVATISDLTMTKGYAKVGGAIYNKGDLNLANVDFVDNEAYWVKSTTGGEHLTEGLGGAIYNVGKLAVDGGSFQGNAATDFGGAIFADTEGETVVKNATFQENSAFAGGAIVAQNGGLTIENTTFASNTAQRAGAIYTLVNATIVASSFVDNSAVAADYSSRNVVGGAIYASKEAKLTFAADIASGSNVAATFEGNTAEAGGAIYAEAGFNVEGDLIARNNSAVASQYVEEVKGDYGAIFANGHVNVAGNLEMTGNAADGSYGAIYANGKLTVELNANLSDNTAKNGSYGAAMAKGVEIKGDATFNNNAASGSYGALYSKGALNVEGDLTANGNVAGENYGAIYANNVVVGGNATFNDNAAGADSGALYANGSLNIGGDLTASGNSADGSYGAIYADNVDVVGNATFNNNTAGADSGALYANGLLNVGGDLTASGNSADGSYGAIYADNVDVVGNATFSNNTAGVDSGALYSNGSLNVGGDLVASGNSADGSYGAIYADNVDVVGNATFSNNTAGVDSGALYSNGLLNVGGDLTASGNSASGSYGAIYADNVDVVGNATFNDNTAGADSGALYANGSLNVGGDLVASGNSATGEYGALAVQGDVDVQGALNASNNTAAKFAGLYAKGDVNVGANATISGNQAVENNAGLFAEGQFLVEGDLEANNNTAAQVAAVQASYVKVGGNAVVNGNVDASETGAIVSGSNIDVVGNATALNNEGGAFNAAGNVVIGGNADFENNTADHGAAIRANDVLIEGDVVLKGNISEFNGGAVDARSFETKGALTATGNVAGERGGAINSATYVKIGVGSSNISGNSAGENGGAIYAIDSVVIGGDAVIASNTAATLPVNVESTTTETIGDEGETIKTTITKTTFSSLGGAIYVAAGGAEFGGSVKFNKNKAGVAGALYAKGGVEVAGDASFANNTADAYIYTEKVVEITPAAGGEPTVTTETATEPIGDYGVAYVEGALSVGGVLEVAGNQANRNYGAIYVAGNLDVVGNATFSGNTAGGSYGAAQIVGTLNIGGALNVENNAANAGDFGALAVGSNVVVTGNAVLKSNVATGSYGALYAAKSVSFGSLEAANNEAGENYGAIYVGTTATINKTAMISGNQAGGNFGGMYVKSALAINNVVEAGAEPVENALTLAGNEAAGNIAALFVGSTLTVNGSATIDANVAGGDFGALRANQAVSILGDLNVTNNVAGGSYGALYVGKGLTVQGDAAFSGNEAQTGSYGAAYVYGAFAANSLTATGNQAGGDVGALYVGNAIDVAGDLNIENNVAGGDVGALRTTSAITVGGNALVSSNSAGGDVGAIRAGVFKTTNADANVVISDNQAGGNVGAMQLLKSRYAMDIAGSVVITGNRAGLNEVVVETEETNGAVVTKTVSTSKVGKYGAIAVSAGFITIGGDATITDNSAAAYGAIYVKNAIEIGGALTMSRNTADGKTTVQTTVETTVENFDENGVLVGTTTSTETSESVSYYGANYGAAYVGSNFIVNGDSTIANNSANDSFGAIYAAMSVTGGSLTLVDNVAGTSVGGIATQSNMTVNGALVATGNRADNVAAIAVAGTLTVNGDATIANNAATTNAGVVAKTTTVTGNLVIDANVAESGHALASTTVAVQGDLTVTNNVNANIWAGTLTVAGDAALESNRGLDGAAIYATNVTVEGSAKILANVASNGGAIYATNVDLNNALIAGNSAVKGGAISAENIRLVNATVAGNTAVKGGALYIGGVAKIDNSIVAGNSVVGIEATEENEAVAGEGADIYAVEGATVVFRNSLLQNAEDTGEVAFSEDWLVAEYRSFVNVDPMFADAANGDYSLTANSPAVNTGSNALAKAGVAEDLAGNPRYVGVEVDGVVYAIDMGAFEFQTVVSANLGFGENPINFWFATVDGEKTDHYIVGNDVVLDFEILNSGETSVFDKFNVTYVVTGTLADGSEYNATVTTRYQADSDYFDWLKNADWFAAGSTQTYARQNLGALPVGSYTIAISLDGANEIVEVDKENNVYTTAFDVYEAPSLVVNTEEDGAFNPLDDKITLREASELYVGPYWYASDILVDSGEFIREDMKVVKVEDGVATVGRNVYVIDEVETTAVDGAQVAYGETYVVFDNGVFTYPDGTTQAYAPGKFDYDYSIDLVLADGSKAVAHRESKFDYLESIGVDAPVSTKYEYVDVVLFADGSKILFSELEADSIVYDQTYMTYRDNIATDSEGAAVVLANGQKVVYNGVEGQFMNGGFIADDASVKTLLTAGDEIQIEGVAVEFVGPAFVLGDGSFVPFVDGSSFATETGLVVETAIRRDAFDAEFVAADGLKYQFANDGTARVSTFVGSDIVFAEGVENITLAGTAITPAKSQMITADANVTISGNEQSNVFVVNYGLDVDMTNLTLVDGLALKGGAIYNAGALVLNNVDVENSFAYTELTVDPQDKVLNDGLGGAIYNSGSLTINEGDFLNNAAQYFGGAIYSIGALNVDKANFVGNESNYFGGAVYVQNSNASFANSKFENNVAKFNGGAIAAAATNADSKVTIVNSLMANNRSKEAEGGAIYAIGQSEKTMEVEATNVTIADNRAALGGGVAVDSASLILKNSILAGNDASYQADDLAIEGTATVVLYASLLGNGEDVVNADALSVAEGHAAFIGTNANPIDPKFGENYALTSASPAVNSGVNSFIEGQEYDLAGNDRILGDYVDLGAYELAFVAPDLAFDTDWALKGWHASAEGLDLGKFVEGWDVAFDYKFGNYGSGIALNSFDYTITVVRLDAEGNPVEGSERVFTRTYGDDVDGFMSEEYWLNPNATVSGYWNLGAFDAGQYQATISLDVNNTVYETSDENNAYVVTFDVAERPSLVVTTELDVVDEFDGLVSLREAISAIGTESTESISMKKQLVEGATFELANGVVATYAEGKLTYADEEGATVELIANTPYELANGEELVWDGADLVVLTSSIADTITFAENVNGKTITLVDGELVIDRDMTISASVEQNIAIDAQNASRILFVAHGDVRVGGLTLLNANATMGAAVYNAGVLALNDMTINTANAEQGAGVYNAAGASLDLWNVSFADMNATDKGGAVYNAGDLVANLATFSESEANEGAAIYNAGNATINQSNFSGGVAANMAGAIYNAAGVLNVSGSNFANNSAEYGGAIVNYQGSATIVETIFEGNSARKDAGAIDNYGALKLAGVSFKGNSATGFGGAIYNSASSATAPYVVTLDSVVFSANNANEKGGAIYNATNSQVVSENGTVKFQYNDSKNGGAIYNVGAVTAKSAWTFDGNRASENGAALYNAGAASFAKVDFVSNAATVNGGAVYNVGAFKANYANFQANKATGSGAALYNANGTTAVSNGLFWLNVASVDGGAIYNAAGTTTLRNATIAANAATNLGGGVYNAGTLKAYNTIIADNNAANAVDLYATNAKAALYNSLVGSLVGSKATPTMNASVVGEAGFKVAPVFVDGKVVNEVDLTLLATSAGVNSGKTAYALDTDGNALVYDLAGEDRVCSTLDAVDMGAFEFPYEEPASVVNTNLDVVDPTDGVISLREALAYAQRIGSNTITFDPSVKNVVLNSTLYVDSDITIEGGADIVTFESNFDGSLVVVGSENEDANVAFRRVAFTGATNGVGSDNPDNAGGAICNYANLSLEFVSVSNNAAAYGGGLYNAGTISIVDSEIVNNSATYYGGVYNRGDMTINRTTIAGNSATYYGGGIGTYTGATIANTAIYGNSASLGGGVYSQVNMADLFTSDASFDLNMTNVTIVGNVATGETSSSVGGGVWVNHVLNLTNSIVYGNVGSLNADLYATTILATSKTTMTNSNVGAANIAISGQGVKSVDPKFIQFDANTEWTKWDLNLQIGSPMINAGRNADVVGEYDVLRNARIVGSAVDMGAFEEQGNIAPTDINIELETIDSSSAAGSLVATLEAVDPNDGDTFVYELTDDADGAFAISGNEIVLAKNLEAGEYSFTVRATDSGEASIEKTFDIVVYATEAPSYGAPAVDSLGRNVNGEIAVQWSSTDPAKEYVVEYRVKGDSAWTASAALTGNVGVINDAFENGSIVQVRIKALASSQKNESEWSEVAEYMIQKAPEAVKVETTQSGEVVMFNVVSNTAPRAYWKIDWNDGSEPTIVTGLAMSRNFSHWYAESGTYAPTLYLDNDTEGVVLDTVVVEVAGSSDAVLDVENVFSELDPVAVDAAAILNAKSEFVWNAIPQTVSVDAAPIAVVGGASANAQAAAVVADESREAAFADLAEVASDDYELDSAVESIFDEAFVNDLFEF